MIDVTARTSLGKLVSSGSDLSLVLVSSTGNRIRGKYESSPTVGVFRFSYSATTPGKYELRISAFGTYIGASASPYSVEIVPGSTSLATTTMDTDLLSSVSANEVTTFAIHTKDAFGNDVLGGDDVQVFVVQKSDTNVAVVTDNVDGSYTVSFQVTKAGSYVVTAKLNSQELSGSPFTFNVDPGPAQGGLSKVQGADIGSAPSGKGGDIKVQAVDASGNALTQGLGVSAVQVIFFNKSQPIAGRRAELSPVNSDDIPVLVTDNGDGSYKISYFPFVDGSFSFAIRIAGVPVPGSPFDLAIQPVFVEPDKDGPMRWLLIVVLLSNFLGACCHVGMITRFIGAIKGRRNPPAPTPRELKKSHIQPETITAQQGFLVPPPAPSNAEFMLLL